MRWLWSEWDGVTGDSEIWGLLVDAITILLVGGPLHGARITESTANTCIVLKAPRRSGGTPRCVYVERTRYEDVRIYSTPEMAADEVNRWAGIQLRSARSKNSRMGLWRGRGAATPGDTTAARGESGRRSI
jgi:hypothetical protein